MGVSRWNYVAAPALLLTLAPVLTLAPDDWLFPHWNPRYLLFLAAAFLQSGVPAEGRPGDVARAHSFVKAHERARRRDWRTS